MEAKKAFTLVELLTVLAIITILLSLLSPATITIRRFARETQQKAELTSIGLALTAFRDDYGDYPPSRNAVRSGLVIYNYCGAQKLAEALLGRDLLGFHPDSQWMLDDDVYNTTEANLRQRRGRYLELTTNVFRLNDLFDDGTAPLAADTFVICDVFGTKKVLGRKIVKAGTPILYYKANTWSKQMDSDPGHWDLDIYNTRDNRQLVGLGKITDATTAHPLVYPEVFYSPDGGVIDPTVSTGGFLWPYRPDSYILISAGTDGLYGTIDDITNF